MKLMTVLLIAAAGSGFLLTPDQKGRRLFEKKKYLEAAEAFHDPMWQGTSLYRAGEFEKAAKAFSRRSSPEAFYNQGNAWLMNGKYETAITAYDRALQLKPDWKEAQENRDLAAARAELFKKEGGDMGDQQIGADEIVFEEGKKNNEGQDTQITTEQAMSEEEFQALWLRRVTTKPADFLKVKFAYQQKFQEGENRE